jgi:DNA-binding transcriptional MerR regulator
MGSYANLTAAAAKGWRADEQKPAAGEDGTFTIGQLAGEFGVSLRTLRFYQAKGLLAPTRKGRARQYSTEDCQRLALILQAKRLCFTLMEVRDMLAAWRPGCQNLPLSRKQCVEQINLLERQRRELEGALHELRQIYTGMFKFGAADRIDRDAGKDA